MEEPAGPTALQTVMKSRACHFQTVDFQEARKDHHNFPTGLKGLYLYFKYVLSRRFDAARALTRRQGRHRLHVHGPYHWRWPVALTSSMPHVEGMCLPLLCRRSRKCPDVCPLAHGKCRACAAGAVEL